MGSPAVGARLAILFAAVALAGCERGCARGWFADHGVGDPSAAGGGQLALNASDCPDGLARCSGGVVQVSQRAVIPQPCKATPEQCVCPWQRLAECDRGCVADDLVVVLDAEHAPAQLCALAPDAGPLTRPVPAAPSGCDETALYRCASGAVVSCADRAVVAVCAHGCAVEGADIGDDEPVRREAAFAILCSR